MVVGTSRRRRRAAAFAAALASVGASAASRAAILNNGDALNLQGTANNAGLAGQFYGLTQPAVAGAEPSISATVTASPNFTAGGFPILQRALNQATPATLAAPNAGATVAYSNINFPNTAFGTNAPFSTVGYATADNVTARWSGYINIDATQAGSTTFFTTSDDGSVVYVDGVRVVNNSQFQGAVERSGSINLSAGLHEVVVGFYEGTGGAGVEFRYDPAGADAKQIVPVTIAAGSTAPSASRSCPACRPPCSRPPGRTTRSRCRPGRRRRSTSSTRCRRASRPSRSAAAAR